MTSPLEILVRRGIPWAELEKLHQRCIEDVSQNPELAFLLVSEPEPTFTRGRAGSNEELLWSKEVRNTKGVGIEDVSRGGRWTYHGPGQIVLYPILQLENFGFGRRGVRPYLHALRAALAEGLETWGIKTEEQETPFGLFADGKKIASFGIGVTHGVTSHGAALYHGDQNGYFSGIHPCGVAGALTTCIVDRGGPRNWETAAAQLIESVKKRFKSRETSVS